MPSQTTDYTCGPCSLIGYSAITDLDLPLFEMKLAENLNCKPSEGTRLIDLAKYAKDHLNATSFGENIWDGKQMMIAIISEKALVHGNFTHAIVVLGKDYLGSIVWWCSWLNEVRRFSLHEFKWFSNDGKYNNWSINFPTTLSPHDVDTIADKLVPSGISLYQQFSVKQISKLEVKI